MKIWTLIKWIIGNPKLLALLYDLYEASKDGKISKLEWDRIMTDLAVLLGKSKIKGVNNEKI